MFQGRRVCPAEFSQLHWPVFQQFFSCSATRSPSLQLPRRASGQAGRQIVATCALLAHCPPRAILHPCRGVPGLLPG